MDYAKIAAQSTKLEKYETVLPQFRPKTGVLELFIGASAMVNLGPNDTRQFEALHFDAVKAAAALEGREVKTVCKCLRCQKDFPSESALRAAHPDEVTLAKLGEAHIFAHFSLDAMDPKQRENIAEKERHLKSRKAAMVDIQKKIANSSDVDDLDAQLNRQQAQVRVIAEIEREIDQMQKSIVGLLSNRAVESVNALGNAGAAA